MGQLERLARSVRRPALLVALACRACCVAQSQKAASLWNIANISRDLNCTSPAAPVLLSGALTQCDAREEYAIPVGISVVRCQSCREPTNVTGSICQGGQLVRCPNGHYCPDTLTKLECPEKTWCREGFIAPQDCTPTVRCLAGNKAKLAGVGSVVLLILFNVCGACCACCFRYHRVRAEDLARNEAAKVSNEDVELGGALGVEVLPLAIDFEDLTMHLRSNNKCVLSGVTGSFPASSLVALMGPSGGGKTTFMNALCGRATYGKVTGTIKINGVVGGVQDIPRRVGFVPQDDTMHADLTVHQNIFYNALLRLPVGTTHEMAMTHTNDVIKVLGLSKVAHNLVGDPEKRGISGGQKKRVNIGLELAAMPSVIFMDEPTSGLDGAATVQLARCLAELRKGGITIICVIHQPRFAVYEAFSHLLLLGAGGRMVYCGESLRMMQYFSEQYFRLPERENPADWMIDIVCGLAPRYVGAKLDAAMDQSFLAPDHLFDIWDKSFKSKQHPFIGNVQDTPPPISCDRATPGRCRQTYLFLTRCVRQWNMWSFTFSLILLFTCGALFGLLQRGKGEFTYQSQFAVITGNGFIFFMLTTVQSRGIFGAERLEYLREFQSGTSSMAYWFAKVLIGLIDVFMFAMAYALPVYWLGPVPNQGFGKYFAAYLLASWYHQGLGMAASVVFSNQIISLLLCVFVPMSLQLAFSGMLIKIKDMSPPQKPFAAISCGRWYNVLLYSMELEEFPPHVLKFKEVEDNLASIEATVPLDDERTRAVVALLILGLALRLWTLVVLVMLKHSEGGGCINQLIFIFSKALRSFGVHAVPVEAKHGDTVHADAHVQRKPSSVRVSSSAEAQPKSTEPGHTVHGVPALE